MTAQTEAAAHLAKAAEFLEAAEHSLVSGLPNAAALATSLQRLLSLKQKSQYQAASVTQPQAESAVKWAGSLEEAARQVSIGRD